MKNEQEGKWCEKKTFFFHFNNKILEREREREKGKNPQSTLLLLILDSTLGRARVLTFAATVKE
jgi:hypothetical protein